MHGTGGGETKGMCVPCEPPAAGSSTAGSSRSSEQGRMGCAVAGSEKSAGAIRLGHHHPSPDLRAVYQLPPHDSQRTRENTNATPWVRCSVASPLLVPKPDSLLPQGSTVLRTSSPTIPLLCCYAPNLSWDLDTHFSWTSRKTPALTLPTVSIL